MDFSDFEEHTIKILLEQLTGNIEISQMDDEQKNKEDLDSSFYDEELIKICENVEKKLEANKNCK